MPRQWEVPEGEGGDFLKLAEGDSALCVLVDMPMYVKKHTLMPKEGDANSFGERFFCGLEEGLGCPICENPSKFQLKGNVASEGFYPLWVESINRAGRKDAEIVQAMKIDSGGWSKIKAYKAAKESQEVDGLEFAGVPFRMTRGGTGPKTNYDIQMRQTARVNIDPEAEPIDVEARALGMLREHHASVSYVNENADQFAGHPGDTDDEDDDGMEDMHAANLSIMNDLAKDAKLVNPATLKAYLKSQNVVVRGPQDYLAAIGALERRIAATTAKETPKDDESPFDFDNEFEDAEEAEPAKNLAGGRVRK